MRQGLLRAVCLALLLAGQARDTRDAHAWSLDEHWKKLTKPVLRAATWTIEVEDEQVINCTLATDLADMTPNQRASVGIVYRASAAELARVQRLVGTAAFNTAGTSDGFHIDNAFSPATTKMKLKDVYDWALAESAAGHNLADWLCVLGITLHAIQDFYCHTNWVVLTSAFGANKKLQADKLPTVDAFFPLDFAGGAVPGGFNMAAAQAVLFPNPAATNVEEFVSPAGTPRNGLQTGNWPVGTMRGAIVPWGHRHPGSRSDGDKALIAKYFEADAAPKKEASAALDLATESSKRWADAFVAVGVIAPGQNAVTGNAGARSLSQSGALPIKDHKRARALVRVLKTFVGRLAKEEKALLNIAGEESALTITRRGGLGHESVTPLEEKTLSLWTADTFALEEVLASPYPVATALSLADANRLAISRSIPPPTPTP